MANDEFVMSGGPGTPLRMGQIIRLTNFNDVRPSIRLGYNAGKNSVFIACLLGLEDRAGKKPIILKDAMAELGWVPGIAGIDWVECAQFLMTCRDWPGDDRDLCRLLMNLKDHGLPQESIDQLIKMIHWPEPKEAAWIRVYRTFKTMYRTATGKAEVPGQVKSVDIPPRRAEKPPTEDSCQKAKDGKHVWEEEAATGIYLCKLCSARPPVAERKPRKAKKDKNFCPNTSDGIHDWQDSSKNTIVACHACGTIR